MSWNKAEMISVWCGAQPDKQIKQAVFRQPKFYLLRQLEFKMCTSAPIYTPALPKFVPKHQGIGMIIPSSY